MIFLKNTSKARDRFGRIQRAIPKYWQDAALDLLKFRHILKHGRLPSVMGINGRVNAVLQHALTDQFVVIPGLNIVTNDGDLYYAQSAVGETPTDDFDAAGAGLRMGSAATSPTKTSTDVTTFLAGSGLAVASTYPKTNDGDASNTGSGTDIVTWLYSYGTSEGNVSGIQEGAIVDDRTTPTAALCHFLFAASFSKTSNDTLKVFVNHEMLGS